MSAKKNMKKSKENYFIDMHLKSTSAQDSSLIFYVCRIKDIIRYDKDLYIVYNIHQPTKINYSI